MAAALNDLHEFNLLQLAWVVRIVWIGVMLGLNALGLSFFVKALHQSGSAAASTVNAGVSFAMTVCLVSCAWSIFFHPAQGLVAVLAFDETVSLQWCAGLALILAGVGAIALGGSNERSAPTEGAKTD